MGAFVQVSGGFRVDSGAFVDVRGGGAHLLGGANPAVCGDSLDRMGNFPIRYQRVADGPDRLVVNPGTAGVLAVAQYGVGFDGLCDECPLLLPVQVSPCRSWPRELIRGASFAICKSDSSSDRTVFTVF